VIKYLNKTVFNSKCEGLVNTVNCIGVMGAGLALEFALRYPGIEEKYEDDCKKRKVRIGTILTYKTDDVLIINFPTKFHWKNPSKIEWIASGLDYLKEHYKEWNIKSIAIPPLGCNNGGLDFTNQVKPLIEKKLKDIEIDVCICTDPGYPEGIEKEMVDAYNESDKEALCDSLKIKGNARAGIISSKKIARFFSIKSIENVGITTYKKIFEYFYNKKVPLLKVEQENLFNI